MPYSWQEDFLYDYNLGYVRIGCTSQGIDVLGEECGHTILALGGTTTVKQAKSETSWASFLLRRFEENGRKTRIYNGDTHRYVSGQELLMLIRDGLLLHPDHIVTVSGAENFLNHAGFGDMAKHVPRTEDVPFVGAFQAAVVNDVKKVLGIGQQDYHLGARDRTPPWRLWVEHMTFMRNLCEDFDIGFTAFLEPHIFAREDGLSEFEIEFLTARFNVSAECVQSAKERVGEIYSEVRAAIRGIEWIEDISLLGSGDPRTPKYLFIPSLQNKAVAEAVYDRVFAK